MSFTFQWPRFSDQFHADAIQLLDVALNKGNKPPVIADRIEVVELEMGTQPPELEIRDIGDLTMNQFRGIFRLTYAGDAHIVLRTKVQANPLYHKKPDIHLMGGSRGMLAANQPLVVPMILRLSNFKLNSYVVLVVSKPKGITLVFKTDPLQNVDINSTFDSINVIQKFIQKEIEGQLRQMFREDLPGIIHRLSQQWIKRSTTVEAPYLSKRPAMSHRAGLETMSNPDIPRTRTSMSSGLYLPLNRQGSMRQPFIGQRRLSTSRNVSARPSLMNIQGSSDIPEYSYDLDTGSFTTEVPEKKAFSHLGHIHRESRGLADLREENSDYGDTEASSFDVIDWDDTLTDIVDDHGLPISEADLTEYESIPAVGGGMITRPRVYHASSLLRASSGASAQESKVQTSVQLTSPALNRLSQSLVDVRQPPLLGPYRSRLSFPTHKRESWDTASVQGDSLYSDSPMYSSQTTNLHRVRVEDDLEDYPFEPAANAPTLAQHQSYIAQSSSSSNPTSSAVQLDTTSALAFERTSTSRRPSVSSMPPISPFSSPYSDAGDSEAEHKIVLRPGVNNAISQLSLLNRSNHTLSPFTRTLEHFTIRSVPPKSLTSYGSMSTGPVERQPVKAKRKRTYRLGGSATNTEDKKLPLPPETAKELPRSPSSAASEFDVSEIDRYFCSHDEFTPHHIHNVNFDPLLFNTPHLRHRSPLNHRKL
ncbi:hypothetical protein EW145_g121 [Phellinidium pouzarii]|uniref:Mitochondrial distribution and morphology protein 34 n=1 Tax=Phellinidium pouzarii TaxID=167371 RepID=A0A4S4LJK4_9AGAM|nr:hypothetical protein EW145_g121 [Phellinidium pouzarii]